MVWYGTRGIKAPALEVLCLHHNSSIIADYTGVQHRSATLSKTHLSWDAPSCSPLHEAWRGCWHRSAPAIQRGAAHAPSAARVSEHQWSGGEESSGEEGVLTLSLLTHDSHPGTV